MGLIPGGMGLAPSGQYYVYPDGGLSNLRGPGAIGPFPQGEAQQKAVDILTKKNQAQVASKATPPASATATAMPTSTGYSGTFDTQGGLGAILGQGAIAAEDAQMMYPSWMANYSSPVPDWQDLYG